jgi:hypothetical protein
MSGVFQNIDPPIPVTAQRVCTPPLVRGEDTLAGWRGGWTVNILDDARHSSVLYACKYFVVIAKEENTRLRRNYKCIAKKDGSDGGVITPSACTSFYIKPTVWSLVK